MKVDRQPCPVCEVIPTVPYGVSGWASHRPDGRRSVDVTAAGGPFEILYHLFFSCERCGAEWPEDEKRTERVL